MVRLEGVSKRYRTSEGELSALREVGLDVARGEFLVVRGPSGSGKTTLLLLMGGMLHPSGGKVFVADRDVYAIGARARAALRAENIGFVFQMYHLVPYLTTLENVLLPAGVGGIRPGRAEARDLLERFGLSERRNHKPAQLSAGERQRAAVARALLNRPALILADEPTGNLDEANADSIHRCLASYCREGNAVVMVTHGRGADACADRVLRLEDGRVQEGS